MEQLRKAIRIVLIGLQGSKFPISYYERDNILHEYMKIIHGDEYQRHLNIGDYFQVAPETPRQWFQRSQ